MDFGSPLLPQRIWDKISRPPHTTCWIWSGALNSGGYGWTFIHGRRIAAHRLMAKVNGQRISHKDVYHTCDNAFCVNPQHLVAAPTRANILDMIQKGRDAKNPTFRNRHAKRCIHGHPFDSVNTYVYANGKRACRTCINARSSRYHMAQRAKTNRIVD